MEKIINNIENFFAAKVKIVEAITNTNNLVFKIEVNNIIYYLKIYNDKAIHIDNEIMLYQILPQKNKNLYKKLVYSNYSEPDIKKFAIFEEIKGKTLAELLDNNKLNYDLATKVALYLIEYFKALSNIKTTKFGNLNNSLEGKYGDFMEYLYEYQIPTTKTLFMNENTRNLSWLPFKLIAENYKILNDINNCITPIDSNFKNIIITEKEDIKIIDPGSIISAPIEMGYGELVAHSYGTIIYDKLIENLGLDKLSVKKLSIYAILSLLNIIAFLIRNNLWQIEKSKPFGNKYTFIQLINMHLNIVNS